MSGIFLDGNVHYVFIDTFVDALNSVMTISPSAPISNLSFNAKTPFSFTCAGTNNMDPDC